jgi:hypothetical protein
VVVGNVGKGGGGVLMTQACTQNLRLKALLGLVNFNIKTGDGRSINSKFNQKALTERLQFFWYKATSFIGPFFKTRKIKIPFFFLNNIL